MRRFIAAGMLGLVAMAASCAGRVVGPEVEGEGTTDQGGGRAGGAGTEPAPSAAAGAGVGGGTSRPPESPEDGWGRWRDRCTGSSEESPAAGDGECTQPPRLPSAAAPCVCWDLEPAPGPEGCPPSPASIYGPQCCYGASCGHDFGNGCTGEPFELPGETADAGPACEVAAGRPGALVEGRFQEVALGDDFIALHTHEGEQRWVTIVSKADCSQRVAYETQAYVGGIATTRDELYVAESGEARRLVRVPLPAGTPQTIALGELLQAEEYHISAIGAGGGSLYALVSFNRGGDPPEYEAAVVEVPCCEGSPRLLGRHAPHLHEVLGHPILVDPVAGHLVIASNTHTLNGRSRHSVVAVDMATGETRQILGASGMLGGYAAGAGRYFAAQPQGILSLDLSSCGWEQVVSSGYEAITEIAFHGGDLFWAESHRSLTVSRLFARKGESAAPVQVLETSGRVEWLGADGHHIYWLEKSPGDPHGLGPSRLMRLERP